MTACVSRWVASLTRPKPKIWYEFDCLLKRRADVEFVKRVYDVYVAAILVCYIVLTSDATRGGKLLGFCLSFSAFVWKDRDRAIFTGSYLGIVLKILGLLFQAASVLVPTPIWNLVSQKASFWTRMIIALVIHILVCVRVYEQFSLPLTFTVALLGIELIMFGFEDWFCRKRGLTLRIKPNPACDMIEWPQTVSSNKTLTLGDFHTLAERGRFLSILEHFVLKDAGELILGYVAVPCAVGNIVLLYATRRRCIFRARIDDMVYQIAPKHHDAYDFLKNLSQKKSRVLFSNGTHSIFDVLKRWELKTATPWKKGLLRRQIKFIGDQ